MKLAHIVFQLVLLLSVIGIIVARTVSRRMRYLKHGLVCGSLFDVARSALGLTLLMEFVRGRVHVHLELVYVRSIWNVLTSSSWPASWSMSLRASFLSVVSAASPVHHSALKVLRALKLGTLVEKMRFTSDSLIISSITGILDTALLTLLYIV